MSDLIVHPLDDNGTLYFVHLDKLCILVLEYQCTSVWQYLCMLFIKNIIALTRTDFNKMVSTFEEE